MLATLRQRNFALLWSGGLVSMMGDWALIIGLPIYVYQLTGSALATSATFIAGRIPSFVLGPIAGVLIDRWDRRWTMVITNILLAASLLPLLFVHSAADVWLVYLVMFIQSSVSQFFGPAEQALLPRLVSEEHLTTANALNSLNNDLARLFGPPLGGLVAAYGGLRGIALLDAASFIAAAVLIVFVTGKHRTRQAVSAAVQPISALWHEFVAGVRLIRGIRPVAMLFGMVTITSVGEGVFSVLFILFVNKVLGGGAQELGWLMSAQAVGGLVGGVIVGSIGHRVAPANLIGFGSILFGLLDLAIFNYPAYISSFMLGIALFVLVGIPGVASRTGVSTIMQTSIADEYRGRVFAAFGTVTSLAALLGTLLAGFLGESFGVVTVLNIQGLGYVLAGVVALVLLRPMLQVARQRTFGDVRLDGTDAV